MRTAGSFDAFDSSESDSFKRMLTISLSVHIALILLACVKTFIFPSDNFMIESAIRVDVVDLPDKMQSQTEALPPEDASPKNKSKPEPIKKIKPIQEAKPINLRNKLKQAESIEKIRRLEKEEKKKKALEAIKEEMAKEEAREAQKRDRLKKALVKGNEISKGSSLTGLRKVEFEEYFGQIQGHMKRHWNLPEWLSDGNLRAAVSVTIDGNGNVIRKVFKRSSGDPRYDDYVMKAIDEASPFPPPPEKFFGIVRTEGFTLGFPL